MHNSQKKPSLNRKQFSTHTSSTPTKKSHPNPHPHPLTQNDSSQSMAKTSYENTLIGTGVSYSQLQIILQNVQQVKKKASEQIQTLERKNGKLEEELRGAREQVKRYENLEETIKEEKIAVQRKYQVEIRGLKDRVGEMEETCTLLSDRITELTQELQANGQEIHGLKYQLQRYKKQAGGNEQRYRKLVQSLQITQQSNQLKQILTEYQNLPNLLLNLTQLKSSLTHSTRNLEQARQSLTQLREQAGQSSKTINTITEENRHLLDVIEELRGQKESLSTSLRVIETEKVMVVRERECTLLEIQDRIGSIRKQSDERVREREAVIGELRREIAELKDKLADYESKEKMWQQEAHFKAMVDQVCDEKADYEKVIKRIEYLEKYRTEYYFNIQKIQFLCKILDS